MITIYTVLVVATRLRALPWFREYAAGPLPGLLRLAAAPGASLPWLRPAFARRHAGQ